MRAYISTNWSVWLGKQGLSNFEAWWALELEAVDETNTGRGGWSTVFKFERDGHVFYVKRQSNHLSRSLASGFRSVPTFQLEFDQVQRYKKHAIPCIEPVFFSSQKKQKSYQAILVTEALEGFQDLDQILRAGIDFKPKLNLIKVLGARIVNLHDAGIEHTNLYPKHIFVRLQDFDIRFIDLETSRHHFGRMKRKLRDIETLSRRASGVSNTDRLRFLLSYLNKPTVDEELKDIWRQIEKRTKKKTKK